MYKICHTAESSRRQRELEAGLLQAMMSQPYEKITLTELCRQLGIPRKSFYRYFPTKEDCLLALMDHTLADCNEIALGGWDGKNPLNEPAQLRFFRYWQEQAAFLDAMAQNGFWPLLLERTTVIVDRMKQHKEDGSFAANQVEYFVAQGLMTTVLRWHHFGFVSSPEEMAAVFGKILEAADISMSRLLL